MPRIFHPRRSDAHRIACLALYRALLKQCNQLSTRLPSSNPSATLEPLQNLIRYRFRRDRLLQSPYAIRDALHRGESHLALLHGATAGSPDAVNTLILSLQSAVDHATSTASARAFQKAQLKPPHKKHHPKIRHHQNESPKANHIPGPNNIPLASLPIPLDQIREPKRKVPYLNEVQGRLAILRWPGQHHQPVLISRVIRQKLKRVEKLHGTRMGLELQIQRGEAEDLWDQIIDEEIAQQVRQGTGGFALAHDLIGQMVTEQDGGLWAEEPKRALQEVEGAIRKMEQERGQRGAWLWEIVKKEKKLSDWETLPERLVRAGINARKLDYLLVALASRMGQQEMADRLWNRLRDRKEKEIKQEEELMMMYWVIPVDWVKNPAPLTPSTPIFAPLSRPVSTLATSEVVASRTPDKATAEEARPTHDFNRGWRKSIVSPANPPSSPTSHQTSQSQGTGTGTGWQQLLDASTASAKPPPPNSSRKPPTHTNNLPVRPNRKQPPPSTTPNRNTPPTNDALPASHPRSRTLLSNRPYGLRRTLDPIKLMSFGSRGGTADNSRKGWAGWKG